MSAVDYLGSPEEMLFTFGTRDTILCDEMEERRDNTEIRQIRIEIRKAEREGNGKRVRELKRQLEENGFLNWLPYDLSDMATGHELEIFFEQLGLVGFPYKS